MRAKRISYSSSTMECMERMLSTWIGDQYQCRMSVSMILDEAKACSVYEDQSKVNDNICLYGKITTVLSE